MVKNKAKAMVAEQTNRLLVVLAFLLVVEAENNTTFDVGSKDYYYYGSYDATTSADGKFYIALAFYVALVGMVLSVQKQQIADVKECLEENQRVLRAVYSQTEIRAQVERILGHELGAVPPISDLTSFGAQAREIKAVLGRRWFGILCPSFLGVGTASVGLALDLPVVVFVLVLVTALIIIQAAIHYGKLRKPLKRFCRCCVCGRSTDRISRYEHSSAHFDCPNCHDTAICSPTCDTCCTAPHSMNNALFGRSAWCLLCNMYGYMFSAWGTYLARVLGVGSEQEHHHTSPYVSSTETE